MNARRKGKRGELEFAEFLRAHGFDARRSQQFSGGADSPDVVSQVLSWVHIEVKRVQHLNLAEACAQAQRDCGRGAPAGQKKPWIVAHRRNREPWFITMDSDALYQLLRKALTYFDLWPFVGRRPITMDAEVFFQFLRAACAGVSNRESRGSASKCQTRGRDSTEGNEGNKGGTDGTHGTCLRSELRQGEASGQSPRADSQAGRSQISGFQISEAVRSGERAVTG